MRAAQSSRVHTRLTRPAVALLAFATLAAACGDDSTTTPTPTTPLQTETLNGQMAPKGTATRSFAALNSGTVTVLLAKTDPPVALGLGIGIRGATTEECDFTQTVNTPAGATPQISVAVDAGTYCAGTYDIGTVGPNGVIVTVTITHP